jgi:tetratricopeptide (TPR) repeat protein
VMGMLADRRDEPVRARTLVKGRLHRLLLGGYPLPLTVVLSVSASTRPSVTLAELKGGGSGADPAGLIHRTLEYSFSKLVPALQQSLLFLAPFSSVISTSLLSTYQDLLQQDEIVSGMGEADLRAALDHAVGVGLASRHPQLPNYVQLHPVLPYFLRSRLHGQPALSASLAQAHYQACRELGGVLHTFLESSDNSQYLAFGQAATQAEYANLRAALAHGLDTGQSVDALVAPLALYLDQTQQDDVRGELLQGAIRAHHKPVTQDQQVELAILHGEAGHTAIRQHRFPAARAHYEAELALRQAAGDPAQGVVYHQLGWIAQEQEQLGEAEENYQAALAIFLKAGDMGHAAGTFHNLATVALEQQKFSEAEGNARKALKIFLEYGDELRAATVYHDLGEMAKSQERFADAEVNYAAAIDIFLEFGSTRNAAHTYFSIAALAQDQQRNADAEVNYRSALDIFLVLDDQHSAARTYAKLGALAVGQQRWEEAREIYRTAIDLFQKSGDRNRAAETWFELGNFQYEDSRFLEAESSYRKALQVFLESGKQDRAAGVYGNLGSLAQQQQNYTEAEASYREALRIFTDLEDYRGAAVIHHNLGALADVQSQYAEAEASYRKALDIRLSADPRVASNTAAGLAALLAKLGRDDEAVRVLASSAVNLRQRSGQWPPRVLRLLYGERETIGPDEFAAIVGSLIPVGLKGDFSAAVDAAGHLRNSTIVSD